jgi:hypothetical protein
MKGDAPFALGGVWRHWRSPDGKTEMDTFAVITTDPNELLAEKTGHDRMPVIIKRTDYQRWLEPSDKANPPVDLLRPFDSDQMKAWRLDRRVNNVRNDEPALWEPLTEEEIPEKPKPAKKSRIESTLRYQIPCMFPTFEVALLDRKVRMGRRGRLWSAVKTDF